MVIETKSKVKPYVIQQRILITTSNGNKFFSKSGWFQRAKKTEWSEWREVYSYSEFSLKNGVIKRVLDNFLNKTEKIDRDIEYRVIKKDGGEQV